MTDALPSFSLIGFGEAGQALAQGLGALSLGAMGVVYGDIGTSPLYTLA